MLLSLQEAMEALKAGWSQGPVSSLGVCVVVYVCGRLCMCVGGGDVMGLLLLGRKRGRVHQFLRTNSEAKRHDKGSCE